MIANRPADDRSDAEDDLSNAINAPAVAGLPRLFLHLEGAALLAMSVGHYAWGRHTWWIFFVFFFTPDVAFFAYLVGPRMGALVYNCLHTTLAPVALIGLAILYNRPALATVGAAIWGAHIGYDRMLGWGLKYPTGYKDTHFGKLWWPPEDGGWLPRRPKSAATAT